MLLPSEAIHVKQLSEHLILPTWKPQSEKMVLWKDLLILRNTNFSFFYFLFCIAAFGLIFLQTREIADWILKFRKRLDFFVCVSVCLWCLSLCLCSLERMEINTKSPCYYFCEAPDWNRAPAQESLTDTYTHSIYSPRVPLNTKSGISNRICTGI